MHAPPETFIIHAQTLLTMPEAPAELQAYDGLNAADLQTRDEAITGSIQDAGVLVEDGHIAWFGPWDERPRRAKAEDLPTMETGVATPGWIECHTHSVFAGERSLEFAARNAGASYIEILEAGGGILQTVRDTRKASQDVLTDLLIKRTFEFIRRGITTLEIKSGYGLTTKHELKMLRAIASAQPHVPCELVPCFMGAHTLPEEYLNKREEYVKMVCEKMLPRVAQENLAQYCDVFCDRGAFTLEETEHILRAAQALGLKARVHADEITHTGAASLAARLGATSADHLEHSTDEDIDAMALANVVGVLMPAVNLNLNTTTHLARARDMLARGMEVALSTDFNPGSAMTQDIGQMLHLGCTLYKMTPGEVLRAVTIGAAKALGREDIGRIREGDQANLTLLDAPSLAYIPYFAGRNHVEGVIWKGKFVYWIEDEGV